MATCKTCGSTFVYCGHGFRRRESRSASATSSIRAPDATCDVVYRELLRQLTLDPAHRQQLHARGLNDREIVRRDYRTLQMRERSRIARAIVERFGEATVAGVPGLYQADRDGHRYWSLAGSPGLLIPVRDLQGRIIAVKIRRDDDAIGMKYTSVSSAAHGGPGPGAPVHIAMCDGTDRGEVRLTEGELAADVCASLTKTQTLSIPGVGMWRRVMPILEAIKPETVLMAFDQDWCANRYVARTLSDCTMALKKVGHQLFVETWPREYKGIDDALAAGCTPKRQPFATAYHARMRVTAKQVSSLSDRIKSKSSIGD